MRKQFILRLGIIILFLNCACRKIDSYPNEGLSVKQNQSMFFTKHKTVNSKVLSIMDYLKRRDDKTKFIDPTISKIGFPHWDKVVDKNRNLLKSNMQNGKLSAEDTSVYCIPFSRENENWVNAFMVVKTTTYDTLFYFICDWQYHELLTGDDSLQSNVNRFASYFILMDRSVFQHTKFSITDSALFRSNGRRASEITLNDSISESSKLQYTEVCETYILSVIACPYYGISQVCTPICDGCPRCRVEVMVDYCWEEADFIDMGMLSGWGIPSGGGGGGSGSPTGDESPPPCPGNIGGRMMTTPGCGPGWIRAELNTDPPHVVKYTLTQHEQDVFDAIDAEDNSVDNNHNNLDCQGTKRTGNIFFQGTKEHWILQLDYISRYPLNGDAEYAIPNSSPAGNRGYADIINTGTGEIFEIKADNLVQISSGVTEVERYVDKANQYCRSSLANPLTGWIKGTSYASRNITIGPNKHLYARLAANGVIGYQTVITPNPTPAPVAIPTSVVDKLRHLVERLKNYVGTADQVIAEYLHENPDLVTYIKGAAYGAAVAIIVGTILEDFATAGAGILDDWAHFTMAYRIVRFALAL